MPKLGPRSSRDCARVLRILHGAEEQRGNLSTRRRGAQHRKQMYGSLLDVGDCGCDDGRGQCCGKGDDVVLRAGWHQKGGPYVPSGEVRERRGGGKDGRDRVGAKSGGFLARGDDGREYDQEDGADGDPFGGFRNRLGEASRDDDAERYEER